MLETNLEPDNPVTDNLVTDVFTVSESSYPIPPTGHRNMAVLSLVRGGGGGGRNGRIERVLKKGKTDLAFVPTRIKWA